MEKEHALRLFLATMRRNDPNLCLSVEDRGAMVRICQLVDGNPLGVELASAWARVISLAEIAEGIERNIEALSAATRDLPAERRSLWALFECLWQFFAEDTRGVFARLSVFRGGFGREAAGRVAGASPFLLATLADRSMLFEMRAGRYEMHELLAAFAAGKLSEMPGAGRDARDRHCGTYARYLRERRERLAGAEQRQASDEIAAEIGNVRAAWRWAVDRGRVVDIEQGLESLYLFYHGRGWVQEGERAFREASASLAGSEEAEGDIEALVYGQLLARQARFSHRLGRHADARELLQRSLALYDRLLADQDSPARAAVQREKAFSLFAQSAVLRGEGEYEAAQRVCGESLALYRACDDRPGTASALKTLGIIQGSRGEFGEAQDRLQEALALYQQIGDPHGTADTLNDLGVVAAGMDCNAEARQYHQRCLAVRRQINDRWGIGTSLNNLGYLAYMAQEYAEARAYLQEGLAIQREIGDRYHVANCRVNLGAIALAEGEGREAAGHLYAALRSAADIRASPLALEALAGIGALLAGGEPEEAERAVELLSCVREHPLTDGWTRGRVERGLAQLATELPSEVWAAARARGRVADLEGIVAEVLAHVGTQSRC
jgi:tetratricopeptide (TPR) repeat protein